MTRIDRPCRLSLVFTLIIATGIFPFASPADTGSSGNSLGELPVLKGPYLGQPKPGLTAELFAPDFISVTGRYEFALSFTPAGDRILFSVQTEDKKVMVLHSHQLDGQWTPPAPVSLAAGARKDEMEAFFSPDGQQVFFAPYDEGMDVRIWQVSVDGDEWHSPSPLRGSISEDPAFYPTMATDGSLYYSNIKERHPYVARQLDDGSWSAKPVAVEFGLHVFIAPNQSFLLLDARADDSLGGSDIYVAFPALDGGWQTPVNLGPGVNTTYGETCPSLSADGKYLFFSRYNEAGEVPQIYWVDTQVIERARAGTGE